MATAFINATLVDGTKDMTAKPGMAVVVDDAGKISWIGPSNEAEVSKDMEVVDLAGKCLLPGLVNMHVHFVGDGKPMSSGGASNLLDVVTHNPLGRAYLRSRIQRDAECALMSGVTTVRGVGDPCWSDIATRDSINAGRHLGPRMLCSGWGVTPPEGHGRGLIAQLCETPEAARELVREVKAHGGDLVKLFITGGVFDAEVAGEPGLVRMPLEMARAAVEEAHDLGLSTATHVESADGVLLALEAGVDTIEHGAPLTPEMIALFRHNGAGRTSSLTCTISPAIPLARMDREKTHSSEVVKANADVVFNGIVECARQALDAGIPVGLGTDAGCPYVTHYDMWREVVYFHELVGVSNQFALHTATLGNAELLGVGDETGSIEVGKSADMIVTDANPLDNLEALRYVQMVMMRGHLIRHPEVRRMRKLDDELDPVLHLA